MLHVVVQHSELELVDAGHAQHRHDLRESGASAPIQTLKRRSIKFIGDVTFTLAACGATSNSSRSRRSRTPVKSDVPPARRIMLTMQELALLCQRHDSNHAQTRQAVKPEFVKGTVVGAAVQRGKASRHGTWVQHTSEDDAVVHISADVQVALAYALLDQPCSTEGSHEMALTCLQP